MPTAYPPGITKAEGETLALSSTLASLGIPTQYHQAIIYTPNSDFRLHLNPALIDVVFFDDSEAAGSEYEVGGGGGPTLWHDMTDRTAVDSGVGTGTVLDSSTTSDFLYLCFADIIGGMRVVMTSANGNAATLTASYRKNDDTWASLSPTDGTISSSATLGQTGSITWTTPTDWKAAYLVAPSQGIVAATGTEPARGLYGFWLRLSWSAALDSDTEIAEIWGLNRNTARGYYRAATEYHFSFDRRRQVGGIGSVEMVLAAGTATAELDWIRTVQ